ncbi:MAG: hypothetical protein C0485_07995 [Pirellula sp.]|nr:hypothetical protein [Pirellula sp.]
MTTTIRFIQDDEPLPQSTYRDDIATVNHDLLSDFFVIPHARDEDVDYGYRRVFAAAEIAVHHNLPKEDVVLAFRVLQAQDPLPRHYPDDEFLEVYQDALDFRERREKTAFTSIAVVPPECDVVDAAVNSLKGTENLYRRGTTLCRIVKEEQPPVGIKRPPGTPTIQAMTTAPTTELISKRARYVKPSKTGTSKIFVPAWLPNLVLARPTWPVPQLEAIIEAPVLRPDGTILSSKGFDEPSGLFLTHAWHLPKPTIEEAVAAINYLLTNFPFVNGASKAAAVAGIITPFSRYAYHDPVPMNLITANVPGSGKSLYTDVVGHIFCGRAMSRMACPSDDNEWRKRILSLALAGDPLMLVDNIAETLQSAALDAALTSVSWSDRFLGESRMVTVPLLWTPFATGNNVVLGGDLPRRVITTRLQSDLERPHERSDFKEPDLLGFVKANRPALIASALKVLTHYCDAGRPSQGLSAFGSFNEWSKLVRSAIVFAGWEDCVSTQREQGADPTIELLRMLHATWLVADPERKGCTVADFLAKRDEPAIAAAIDSVGADQLPFLLRRHKLRAVGGHRFQSVGKKHGAQLWAVTTI